MQRAEHAASARPNQKKNSPGRSHSRERRPDRAREEQHGREQDQEQVQPVDAELVVDPELADPDLVGRRTAGRPRRS